jgi:hypothetical protein
LLRAPDLLPFALSCYARHSRTLLFEAQEIPSVEGAQQGDPLGPLLFSLALRRVWAEFLPECSPCIWGAFYVDDGVLAGNVAAVRSTFDAFRTACSRHGLRINTDIIMRSGSPAEVGG